MLSIWLLITLIINPALLSSIKSLEDGRRFNYLRFGLPQESTGGLHAVGGPGHTAEQGVAVRAGQLKVSYRRLVGTREGLSERRVQAQKKNGSHQVLWNVLISLSEDSDRGKGKLS